jgi:hypothetical protein
MNILNAEILGLKTQILYNLARKQVSNVKSRFTPDMAEYPANRKEKTS